MMGDACAFSVRELELKVDVDQMEKDMQVALENHDDSYGYGDHCASNCINKFEDNESNQKYNYYNYILRNLTKKEKSLVKDFEELENACDSIPDVMEVVFGNHVKVTATADGFEVDEYEHD